MVCILVYLNYFYCKDIPFIVKRKENIGIFTLSLQYSNFEIPIKMEIDLTTPALLFSAISLIMLAYTNRFLSYAQLVRTLKDQYRENHSAVTAAQIANLRKRLYLTRAMQVTGPYIFLDWRLCCSLFLWGFLCARFIFRSRRWNCI